MAWRRIGDKPLSGPMLTRFTDAYIRQYIGGDELIALCNGMSAVTPTHQKFECSLKTVSSSEHKKNAKAPYWPFGVFLCSLELTVLREHSNFWWVGTPWRSYDVTQISTSLSCKTSLSCSGIILQVLQFGLWNSIPHHIKTSMWSAKLWIVVYK